MFHKIPFTPISSNKSSVNETSTPQSRTLWMIVVHMWIVCVLVVLIYAEQAEQKTSTQRKSEHEVRSYPTKADVQKNANVKQTVHKVMDKGRWVFDRYEKSQALWPQGRTPNGMVITIYIC